MGFGNLGLDDDLVQNAIASENKEEQTGETNTPQPATEDATEPKTLSVLNRPIRKIGGGGVLQYPVDLDTDIQDYFEIQIFKYRKASRLPSATTETENSVSGFSRFSNQRGLRQNQRLQELQSTIQLPIPNSVKDNNVVGWGEGEMSGVQGDIMNSIATSLLDQSTQEGEEKQRKGIINVLKGVTGDTFNSVKNLVDNPIIRRRKTLSLINAATSQLGVGIDVTQALSRFGVVENPNLELLLKGPSLRSFSFNIRFTPRSPEESRVIRMIIRAFKQHSAIKRNGQLGNNAFSGAAGSTGEGNYLLGTPDVFKLRYIKARTQKDIKGLNKFKTCALTGVSVDYTGESGRFSAYDEDSQPVTTIISLSFSELLPIYDTDYSEFTTDDDVGL